MTDFPANFPKELLDLFHTDYWRKCNACKVPLNYGKMYYVCNVSTCNRKRTGLTFCSVSCWDSHLPDMNHREAWAEEKRAPTIEVWKEMLIEESKPKVRASKKEEVAPVQPVSTAPKVIRRSKPNT